MARYYFDTTDSRGLHRDEVGDEFNSFDEARDQCQGILADCIREELPDGELHTVTCDVRDETGRVVYGGELKYRGTRSR